MLGLVALLDKCWTPEAREACVKALAGKAEDGDMEAIKLLFNYAFGKPKEVKEHEHGGTMRIEVAYVDRPLGRGKPS